MLVKKTNLFFSVAKKATLNKQQIKPCVPLAQSGKPDPEVWLQNTAWQ